MQMNSHFVLINVAVTHVVIATLCYCYSLFWFRLLRVSRCRTTSQFGFSRFLTHSK